MITAKNYVAQAIRGLKEYSIRASLHPVISKDVAMIDFLSECLSDSQHFVMPDGGKIIDDRMKGIRGENVRLPYPAITIEYYTPFISEEISPLTPAYASKRVVYAREIRSEDLLLSGLPFTAEQHKAMVDYSDIYIYVKYAAFIDGAWVPSSGIMLIPSCWDKVVDNYQEPLIDREDNFSLAGIVLPYLINSVNFYADEVGGIDKLKKEMTHDLGQEVRAVLELCEALSCSNVEQTIFQEASPKNNKRVRDGKLPMYETKCLAIKMQGQKYHSGLRSTSSHKSPRQHLRRGHIRRLTDKNVWVNSCVVGSHELGVIEKSYLVA